MCILCDACVCMCVFCTHVACVCECVRMRECTHVLHVCLYTCVVCVFCTHVVCVCVFCTHVVCVCVLYTCCMHVLCVSLIWTSDLTKITGRVTSHITLQRVWAYSTLQRSRHLCSTNEIFESVCRGWRNETNYYSNWCPCGSVEILILP